MRAAARGRVASNRGKQRSNGTADARYMRMALELASKGSGQTFPNPMVGAVVVRNGCVVGRGFHQKAGGPHAEVRALTQAGSRAQGSTLYVSLEPCTHIGRTPPCTQAIKQSGIRRVVAAMLDPNPLNQGRGIRWLSRRRIRTQVGPLKKEAASLNRVFVTRMQQERPFITVKVAQSLDGKIATVQRESQWISGSPARRWVAGLRAQSDAILVGIETVLCDNPRLTVRGKGKGRQPIKIILDSRLRTPPRARLFLSRSPVLIATTPGASRQREAQLRRAGAEIIRLPSVRGRVNLRKLLKVLADREVSRLLIEGGGEIIASAFAACAVDRVCWVIAPVILGGGKAPTSVEGSGIPSLHRAARLKNVQIRRLGLDLLVRGDVEYH